MTDPAPFGRCLVALSRGLACVLSGALAGMPASAQRPDRQQPLVVEADREGTIDTARGVTVFSGNAQIAQGTMLIRADRVEVRDPPGGPRTALAVGTPGRLATFRQKRDGVDEHVEAQAERIEYDGGAETLRFIGQAALRRLRSGLVADETLGARITWNTRTETLTVEGGAPSAANPSGRVRATFSPASSSAASAPTARTEPGPPRPSRAPGDAKK